MKRLILSLVAVSLCSIASAVADENVRAAQARLKEGGFYFGEADGVYSSETAAAVSRYQIRNGLQISGQLDAETSKALGIAAAEKDAPALPSESDTWRRLRKTDQQFLTKFNANRPATPAPKVAVATPPPATRPLQPAAEPAGNGYQVLVLSRERLRDYVGAFILAGLDPGVGAELEFFADRVKYYGDGLVGREKIQRDLQRYNERWPQRRFWLAGEVDVQPQADSRLRVTFPLRFELRNGSKQSSGKVRKSLLVEVAGEDLQIVAVSEQKLK